MHVIEDVSHCGKRVSTTNIKELLLDGKIEQANELLGESYSISGEVAHGRAVGSQMGFPTANVIIPSEKAKIKVGVYKTIPDEARNIREEVFIKEQGFLEEIQMYYKLWRKTNV